MTDKLKPCPFCGGQEIYIPLYPHLEDGSGNYLFCKNCEAQFCFPSGRDDLRGVANCRFEQFNRRANEPKFLTDKELCVQLLLAIRGYLTPQEICQYIADTFPNGIKIVRSK